MPSCLSWMAAHTPARPRPTINTRSFSAPGRTPGSGKREPPPSSSASTSPYPSGSWVPEPKVISSMRCSWAGSGAATSATSPARQAMTRSNARSRISATTSSGSPPEGFSTSRWLGGRQLSRNQESSPLSVAIAAVRVGTCASRRAARSSSGEEVEVQEAVTVDISLGSICVMITKYSARFVAGTASGSGTWPAQPRG